MYRIGEIAKLADVTPDTIRYYEKQQMMEHEVRTEGGFRLYTDKDLQRLKFIRHARQLGFTLESIRELLSITPLRWAQASSSIRWRLRLIGE